MLVDLYVREYDGAITSITNIWGATNAKSGTARRILKAMERRGLVSFIADTVDGRRTLVRMTAAARRYLEDCFDIILEGAAPQSISLPPADDDARRRVGRDR